MKDLKTYAPGFYDATVRRMQRQKEANISKFVAGDQRIFLTRDVLDSIGLLLIPFKSADKIGFIDALCNIVAEPIYDEIKGSFRSVLSFVAVRKEDKWTLINSDCMELLPYTRNHIIPGYDSPITTIQNQQRSKVVNALTGEVIVNGGFDYIDGFRYGFARVKKDNLWGIINDKGTIVLPIEYSEMYRFYDWHEPTTIVKSSKDGSRIINLNNL